jgi:hypothetical protein
VSAFEAETGLSVEGGTNYRTYVSPDGRYLLFETRQAATGYDSHGILEAYLYDSAATGEPIVCVSCRQDGAPPAPTGVNEITALWDQYEFSPFGGPIFPEEMVIRNGEPIVFFASDEGLAHEAIAGEGGRNIYEWAHGQVFLIQSDIPGTLEPRVLRSFVRFDGASAEGEDLYITTNRTLTWQDGDQRESVYDARIGGGFSEPPPPTPPCSAGSEGSCQAAASSPPPPPTPASTTFVGPDNHKSPQCKRGQVRKAGKCMKKSKHHKKNKKPKNKKPKKKQDKKGSDNKNSGRGVSRPAGGERRADR